ncbi:MAG: 50S ribosomal protein L4 [Candidatus Nealsonbacteria bacterium DGGOD1a]|nr:MAG: 50S ribosomal protein L4 [Candidatus Nealsonbacteria bacterium DGGOD1a]
MQVTTYNQKGEAAGTIELPKDLFEVKMNRDLVYQVATTQMNNRRQSTAHTKGRGQVSGGGKKPWRQKGTGRARQGSIRSPQWRHGGVVFGPTNEKIYGGKINKKMRRKALAMILTAKVSANSLFFLESLAVSQPKTKEMLRVLESVRKVNDNFKKGKIMIALPAAAKNEILASRNLADVKTIEAAKLNVLDLLNTKCLLMPVGAISDIGAIAAKKPAESKKKEAVKIVKTVKKPVNKKK